MTNDSLIEKLGKLALLYPYDDHCVLVDSLREAIAQLKKMDELKNCLNHVVAPKPEPNPCCTCIQPSAACPIFEYRYEIGNKIKVLKCVHEDHVYAMAQNDKA